jgi:Domain of unknown function (DUF4105)
MLKKLILIFSLTVLLLTGAWCSISSLYSPAFPESMRLYVSIACAALTLLALYRPRRYTPLSLLSILLVFIMWFRIQPSNDRDWRLDLARLPYADINGDQITIHNIRDFNYRSEDDFDPRFTTKTVNVNELSSVDFFSSYWSGKTLAHIFITFGFAEKDYITFSIEVRKTKSQAYSTIAGFFRNYELMYVVAEERDVVGLRTIYRQPNEQVYMLRLRYYKENAIKFFLKYIENMNSLISKPDFYNTVTTNCTTQVLANTHGIGSGSGFKYDWRVLLSGYMPEFLKLAGRLDDRYTLEEILQKGYVNPRAQDVSDAAAFSKAIREGVPRPPLFE